MLVVSRKDDEKLILSSDILDFNIEITVLSLTKGIARLGINAPKNINIDREEVYISKMNSKNEKSES